MLSGVPLFEPLDAATREELAKRVDVEKHAAGKVIFSRGDPGESMYVVLSGEVEITVKNDTGETMVLERAQPGDFFGEISLLDLGPRTATAKAVSDLEAVVVDRGDLDELLKVRPDSAQMFLTAMGKRLRETARLLRGSASRNVNEEEEDRRTSVMKVADWISEFSGSLPFLFLHCGIFFVWIALNVGPLGRSSIGGFDPFPFGLLTMVVSLEAIILSVFVLLSQNRQVARDRVRNDIEYQVNLRAELEVSHLHEKLDQMNADLLAHLATLERAVGASPSKR
jgi:CRP/FNR family cyclic AMP-dependent transcriptional regulator